MRAGEHLIVCVNRTPREYRFGIEFKPFWVNGFGWRQVVLNGFVGSLRFAAIWEWQSAALRRHRAGVE